MSGGRRPGRAPGWRQPETRERPCLASGPARRVGAAGWPLGVLCREAARSCRTPAHVWHQTSGATQGQLREPGSHLAGVDWLESEAGRGRHDGQLCHLLRGRQDQVVKLGGAQGRERQAGVGHDPFCSRLGAVVAEQGAVSSAGDGDTVGADDRDGTSEVLPPPEMPLVPGSWPCRRRPWDCPRNARWSRPLPPRHRCLRPWSPVTNSTPSTASRGRLLSTRT